MRTLRFLPVLALLLTLAACDSATDDTVAGTYRMTQFRADTDDNARTPLVDVLALGGAMTITLGEDGTLSGVLTVPESLTGEDIGPVTPFGGTYVSSPTTVTFRSDVGLFFDGRTWTFEDGQIRLEASDISAVFEKQ